MEAAAVTPPTGWNRLAPKTSCGTRERTPTCRGQTNRNFEGRERISARGVGPGRRGCYHPRPPQSRTCRFPASGSSRESFADGVVVDHSYRSSCDHRHSLIEGRRAVSPVRLSIVVSWTGLQGSCPFPCVPPMVLSSRRLPSLLRVPASLVPRSHRYYEGATTSHLRVGGRLFGSLPPPT